MNYTPIDTPCKENSPFFTKENLKRILALIVALIVSTYLFDFVASNIISLVYFISKYTYGEFYALDRICQTFVYVCALFLPALLFVIIRRQTFKECFDLSDFTGRGEKISFSSVVGYFLCAFTVSTVMAYITSFFTAIFSFDSTAFDMPFANTFPEYILDIIGIAVIPAILEEFVFRGILLRELLPFGKTFAVFTSAVFFASAHGSLEQITYSFVYGLLFALIAVKTGSLLTGIIIHFLNNAFSCTMDFVSKILPEEIFSMLVGILTVCMITAGLIITVYLISRGDFDISEKNDKDKLSLTDAFAAYLSPAVISYGIFVIAETVISYIWR